MCTHELYIFSCAHVVLSPAPVGDCPYKARLSQLQMQHSLHRQRMLAQASRPAERSDVQAGMDESPAASSALPKSVAWASATTPVASARGESTPASQKKIDGAPKASHDKEPSICEKANQHPYRSHLIDRICIRCSAKRQARLYTILQSGMMEGVVVEEGRWKVRLEGDKRRSGASVASSVASSRASVGAECVRQKRRTLEQFQLGRLREGRGTEGVIV